MMRTLFVLLLLLPSCLSFLPPIRKTIPTTPLHVAINRNAHVNGCTEETALSVPILRSAKSYFSSPAVVSHFIKAPSFPIILPTATTGWRTQAKLVAFPKSSWGRDGCYFGLYRRGSHVVERLSSCPVHHPLIDSTISALETATSKAKTTSFREKDGTGDLRYVQIQADLKTNSSIVTLVWNADSLKRAQPSLSRLVKRLSETKHPFHSIWLHCNDGIGNSILSRGAWHRLSGSEFSREDLPVGGVYYTPMVFRQGNAEGFREVARHVAGNIPAGSAVCELYAGVGVLGLTARPHLALLRCSDENPSNDRCFAKGARSASHDAEVSYLVASAARALREGQALGCDVLVVDPPRKGLEEEVLREICKPWDPKQTATEGYEVFDDYKANLVNDVTRLVYVSCGFDALANDCEKILGANVGWKIEDARGFVLFPGSNHVETVVVFKRRGAA